MEFKMFLERGEGRIMKAHGNGLTHLPSGYPPGLWWLKQTWLALPIKISQPVWLVDSADSTMMQTK